ncbi:brain protein I3-like [Daphnia pulex]|uniref:brain protein I3-like n=1 Tax=Daphnia pulex TaxID=6669 RepID=UPI001EE0FE79|nr:brain protein I3-like [Daphnia pulex]
MNANFDDPPPAYTPFVQQPISSSQTYGSTGGHGGHGSGATTVIITPNPSSTIFLVGGCPACRVGVLDDEFTFLGLLCCILFFPIGILCCLALRQRRCLNCGAVF